MIILDAYQQMSEFFIFETVCYAVIQFTSNSQPSILILLSAGIQVSGYQFIFGEIIKLLA